jgi:hypothetical protein
MILGAKLRKKMQVRKKKDETLKNICIYEKEFVILQRNWWQKPATCKLITKTI